MTTRPAEGVICSEPVSSITQREGSLLAPTIFKALSTTTVVSQWWPAAREMVSPGCAARTASSRVAKTKPGNTFPASFVSVTARAGSLAATSTLNTLRYSTSLHAADAHVGHTSAARVRSPRGAKKDMISNMGLEGMPVNPTSCASR